MPDLETTQKVLEKPAALIDQMLTILEEERAALSEHRLDDLDLLQTDKADVVRQLSGLNPDLIQDDLHQALGRCERKNLENGALITLLQGHVAGSLAVLTGAGAQTQTYDEQGRQQHQTLSGGFATSA